MSTYIFLLVMFVSDSAQTDHVMVPGIAFESLDACLHWAHEQNKTMLEGTRFDCKKITVIKK